AFDPVAMAEAQRLYGDRPDLVLAPDKYAALEGADGLAICTEWQQFRAPDFDEMGRRLKSRTIFDGRNIFAPERLREEGWTYLSVGRPAVLPAPVAVGTAT
ncbi:MAG TPA: UDP binding domain-containing protein, partial [Devosia sp.]|nr:UDP binding domain-containing protein [Devosia sp.]